MNCDKSKENIPLVEKFRPTNFDDIVLDPLNKQIFKTILETGYFPNLLFYGPPGTGKTTTIINLVNAYQKKYNQHHKGLMIHLNASDERGIDIIRNQINQFVNSKTLFRNGMKFVILDEVDYMTKNAQQALRYLLQNYSSNVRFCLICNYISRIDEGLQNEFLRLRFNQLPEQEINKFLFNIVSVEKLDLNNDSLKLIQQLYNSDIRSMINFMQSNQNIKENNLNIISESVWENFYKQFETCPVTSNGCNNGYNIEPIIKYINNISIEYNIDKKNIIKDFLNYIIRKRPELISIHFLNFVENIMHNQECKNSHYVYYSLLRLISFIPKDPKL
jgi:DNA polymerase III delta prime subunit